MSKYDVGGSQIAFQPGSGDTVLANKLGITHPKDMDDAELELLEKLYERVLNETLPKNAITTRDLKTWHRWWLSPIYEWAGVERSVNMGKGGFEFAAAAQIPRLLSELNEKVLARDYAPWDENKKEYFRAIHAGMDCNYAPMMDWVERAFNAG